MAEAPGRKVCRCRQRGHGGGGEGKVVSGKGEVKEEKGTGSRLRTPPPQLFRRSIFSAGAADCKEASGGLGSDHPSGTPERLTFTQHARS